MKTRLIISGIFLFIACSTFAQRTDTSSRGFIDIPFSISLDAPGFYFMNFQNLNTSSKVIANLNNADYMPGVSFNFGPRERFYISAGAAGRSFQHFADYTFYSSQVNDDVVASAPVQVVHRKYHLTFYKSLRNFERSTLYGFAGWQSNRTTVYGWRLSPNTYGGITNANFQIRQDWNVNLGLMYDFLKLRIINYKFSLAVRGGYAFPVAKTKWTNERGPMERLEKTNAAGPHVGLIVTIL